MLSRLILVVIRIVAPHRVHADRVTLVVNHDVGPVISYGDTPVIEFVKVDVWIEFTIRLFCAHIADAGD